MIIHRPIHVGGYSVRPRICHPRMTLRDMTVLKYCAMDGGGFKTVKCGYHFGKLILFL